MTTHLADIAATLSAGQFGALTCATYDGTLTEGRPGFSGKTYDYAYKAVYDPERQRIFFIGGADPAGTPALKFIYYDIPSNTAGLLNVPAAVIAASFNYHTYGHLAYIPSLRQIIYRITNTALMYVIDVDEDTVTDIDDAHWSSYDSLANNFRAAMDYFPEISGTNAKRVMYLEYNEPAVWTHSVVAGTSWVKEHSGFALGSLEGSYLIYNPKHKFCYLGGGLQSGNYTKKLFKLNANASITSLADANVGCYCVGPSVPVVDPVSGKLVIMQAVDIATGQIPYIGAGQRFDVQEYDPDTDTWSRLTAVESNIPASIGQSGDPGWFDVVGVSLVDLGVIAFLSKEFIYIYKHTTNTWASGISHAIKAALPGVTSAPGYESISEINPAAWDTTEASLNTEMLARGHTNAGITFDHTPGQAIMAASATPDYTIPTIDTVTYRAAGGGLASLRFDTPGRTAQDVTGYTQHNIDSTLHASGDSIYASPKSPHGKVMFYQWAVRLSATMLDTTFRNIGLEAWPPHGNGCSTSGAGSLILTMDAGGDPFTADMVGRECWTLKLGIANWLEDEFFTITGFIDAHNITLDHSPSPAGAATGGYVTVGGDPDTSSWHGSLSTSGAGSTTLTRASGDLFTATMIGKTLQIYLSGDGFVAGNYVVQTFINASNITLDFSPSPAGAGSNGYGHLGDHDGGWKMFITSGNPPYGHHETSLVLNNGTQVNYPSLYGSIGAESEWDTFGSYAGPQSKHYGKPFVADTWMEFTLRVEVNDTADSYISQGTRVTLWVDADLACNWTAKSTVWSEAIGIPAYPLGVGEFEFTGYQTRKDPTHDHATCYMWIDDVVVSTEPIPMVTAASGGEDPDPEPEPPGPEPHMRWVF